MIKTNEILRQYYLNLFTSSAEITKNGDKNYIYKWNIRDLQLNNAEIEQNLYIWTKILYIMKLLH
jgi:hypothetical protein